MRKMSEEAGDLRPWGRRVREAKVITCLVRGGRCYRFSVEDVVARHWPVDRRKGVGIVTVAGLSEKIIAGACRIMLAEFEGSGYKVKDGQIGFGARGVSDVGKSGGNGRIQVGTSEKGIALFGGVGNKQGG